MNMEAAPDYVIRDTVIAAMRMCGALPVGQLPTTSAVNEYGALLYFHDPVFHEVPWLARQIARLRDIPDSKLPPMVLAIPQMKAAAPPEPGTIRVTIDLADSGHAESVSLNIDPKDLDSLTDQEFWRDHMRTMFVAIKARFISMKKQRDAA